MQVSKNAVGNITIRFGEDSGLGVELTPEKAQELTLRLLAEVEPASVRQSREAQAQPLREAPKELK